jgi:hypothetical protein
VDELQDRWRIETQAALIGWHMSGAMSDESAPPRPALPDWLDVRREFDRWLISAPSDTEVDADGREISPETLDVMIAYGWKDVDDD